MTTLYVCVGYLAGFIISVILFRPLKSWQDGYDAAKTTYNSWDKGFSAGYDAAKKLYTNYEQGFRDGWHACEKEARNEGRSDQQENGG